jgi:hypothetical protein
MDHIFTPPELIKDTTVVTNYIHAYNPKDKCIYVIHSELPFKKFSLFIDYLIDYGYIHIREISSKDFDTLSIGNIKIDINLDTFNICLRKITL